MTYFYSLGSLPNIGQTTSINPRIIPQQHISNVRFLPRAICIVKCELITEAQIKILVVADCTEKLATLPQKYFMPTWVEPFDPHITPDLEAWIVMQAALDLIPDRVLPEQSDFCSDPTLENYRSAFVAVNEAITMIERRERIWAAVRGLNWNEFMVCNNDRFTVADCDKWLHAKLFN